MTPPPASASASAASSAPPNHVRVALCQFPVGLDKAVNHQTASSYLKRAAEQGAQLAVLPEIWNGPYATAAFRDYAEVLPMVKKGADGTNPDDNDDATNDSSLSPSAKLLQDHARDLNMIIVGGSIPEREDDKLYNKCSDP